MSFPMRSALAAAVMSLVVPMASANVLTFDDLSGSKFFASNYMGFQFGNNDPFTNDWYWDDVTNPYNPPRSGTWVGTANVPAVGFTGVQEDAQAISSATPFVFQGAWFSGDGDISYKLYNGSTLVASTTPITLNPTAALPPNVPAPVFIASNYNGPITSVVVNGIKQYYAMDDFTYNPAPVPEVSTYAMMLAGLSAVGFMVRRRKA